MKFQIVYSFKKIYLDWKRLYNLESDPSPFFNPGTFKIAYKYFYPYYIQKKCRPCFGVIWKNNEIKAIIPLLKFSYERYQLFGYPNGFNESGILYDSNLNLQEIFNLIERNLGKIEMIKIDERSPISELATEHLQKRPCVEIRFEQSFECYFANLSSSVRQNIRTAYNRMHTDGKIFSLSVFSGNDPKFPLHDIINLYCLRHSKKYNVHTSLFKKLFLKYHNFASRIYRFGDNALTFYLKIDDKPAAFLSGVYNHNRIIIPRLSINDDFKRYSPGLMLVCETIKYLLTKSDIRILDLSFGDEKYKYDLGGIRHYVYNFSL